jgi:hypothetical protein
VDLYEVYERGLVRSRWRGGGYCVFEDRQLRRVEITWVTEKRKSAGPNYAKTVNPPSKVIHRLSTISVPWTTAATVCLGIGSRQ